MKFCSAQLSMASSRDWLWELPVLFSAYRAFLEKWALVLTALNPRYEVFMVIFFVKGIALIVNFSVSICCGQGIWYKLRRYTQQRQVLWFVVCSRNAIPVCLKPIHPLAILFPYAWRGGSVFRIRTFRNRLLRYIGKPSTFSANIPFVITLFKATTSLDLQEYC
jgi:hypothetical protein